MGESQRDAAELGLGVLCGVGAISASGGVGVRQVRAREEGMFAVEKQRLC